MLSHYGYLSFFPPDPSAGPSATTPGESAPIRAPASLWRCSRIMHLLRDLHPTLLSALEGIVDQVKKGGRMSGVSLAPMYTFFIAFQFLVSFLFQMIWFRENWYEELLRQLNEGLVLCQAAAFENRSDGECLSTCHAASHLNTFHSFTSSKSA